ncbi:MAG: helix-turn-helix domain-containing protein [Acidobacteriota bacterium]|nr:helix-turn-helix domain-containing protein [Acidobacteriota bacterium]
MDPRDDTRARLGANIRDLRVRHKLTQEALGERAGLSYKFIGEVERGIGNPSVDSLAAIAGALDTDIADLFGGATRKIDTYASTRRQIAVVRDAQARLATAIKDWHAATLGRVPRGPRKRKKKT